MPFSSARIAFIVPLPFPRAGFSIAEYRSFAVHTPGVPRVFSVETTQRAGEFGEFYPISRERIEGKSSPFRLCGNTRLGGCRAIDHPAVADRRLHHAPQGPPREGGVPAQGREP